MRQRFAQWVIAEVDLQMTKSHYFCLYNHRSTEGPAWPEFYRQAMDQNGLWRCEIDPNLVDLAHNVRDNFKPIYGAAPTLLLITPVRVPSEIARKNFSMIKPDVLARILADPEFRTYETAKAVAMAMLAETQRSS
jgi:hypothetical protein